MEVADDGNADALLVEFLDDGRDGGGRIFVVHGDAHQFGPARASATPACTVEGTSAVSVLVMDCTTTGASLPTRTPPTVTVFCGEC